MDVLAIFDLLGREVLALHHVLWSVNSWFSCLLNVRSNICYRPTAVMLGVTCVRCGPIWNDPHACCEAHGIVLSGGVVAY